MPFKPGDIVKYTLPYSDKQTVGIVLSDNVDYVRLVNDEGLIEVVWRLEGTSIKLVSIVIEESIELSNLGMKLK